MRLVTFTTEPPADAGRDDGRLGVLLDDGTVLDVVAAGRGSASVRATPATMLELLERWDDALPTVRALADQPDGGALLPGDSVRLLAPVPRPPRLRDYLTYEQHVSNVGITMPPAFEQMPICYKGNPFTVVGPEVELPWPAYTDQLDYELELGFYVAGSGVDLSVEEAAGHIAGVTLFNDVSARDIQMVEMSLGIGPSKGKDFCNVMGPCLVTMDEVDEFDIELVARVNGEEWSRGTSGSRRYCFAEVLAWASWSEPIVAGEFLAVGTVGGGCGLELGRWLEPGDVVELEATRIGVLRSRVGPRQSRRSGTGLDSYEGAPRFVTPTPVASET